MERNIEFTESDMRTWRKGWHAIARVGGMECRMNILSITETPTGLVIDYSIPTVPQSASNSYPSLCTVEGSLYLDPENPLDPTGNHIYIRNVLGGNGYGAHAVRSALLYGKNLGCLRAHGWLSPVDLEDHGDRLLYFWGRKMGFTLIARSETGKSYDIELALT